MDGGAALPGVAREGLSGVLRSALEPTFELRSGAIPMKSQRKHPGIVDSRGKGPEAAA